MASKELYARILKCKNLVAKASSKGVIDLDVIPEEYLDDGDVNPEVVMTDLYYSVVWLLNQLEGLKEKYEKLQTEFDHISHHVIASETNLRVLRETLTYSEEKELPPIKKCYMAGEEVGKVL